MCGIAGIFRPSHSPEANLEFVRTAAETMVHRGPDGRGEFANGPAALGMTRLAIIDVEGSDQPLFNEDGRIALVCNGEIYNYRELRQELMSRGHRFRTRGDCEVLVHLYEEFGFECCDRVRGMFAFILWDDRAKRLLVGRDRLGIKPLYWVARDDSHAFCSEQRALVVGGMASTRLSPPVVLGYLRNTHSVDAERSLLDDVHRVPPGSMVEVGAGGSRVVQYWREPDSTDAGRLEDVFIELEDASAIHQRADVSSAVLLSSGIDSSLVTSLAVRGGVRPRVITVGYHGVPSQEDESVAAGVFAQSLGLSMDRMLVEEADLWRGFEEMSARVDEPAADPSSVVQWLLYRHAREQGCRVVHTGIGGDEVFYGYTPWNRVCAGLEASAALHTAKQVGRAIHALAYRHLGPTSRDEGLMGIQPASMARARILSTLLDGRRLVPAETRAWTGYRDAYRTLRRTYLLNNGLLLADKIGMAASVEVRGPLVDHRVVEAALSLPLSIQRPQRGFAKPVLRAALERSGRDAWGTRRKRGFEIPTELVSRLVRAHLDELDESTAARELFSSSRWRALVDLFAGSARDWHRGRVRDRLHRRAWIVSAARRPDAWSLSTFLYSVLCLERCRRYWASHATASRWAA